MSKRLLYLLDPLCGWCYGAAPTLSLITSIPDLQLELYPTGLFSGAGARPMDHNLAAYAWANDQRISGLTGQVFSDQYRIEVLSDFNQPFDSGPATDALTAVSLTAPERQFDALEAIQHARYVDGRDVTEAATLMALLHEAGLTRAAALLGDGGRHLNDASQQRASRARSLMRQFGLRGVPGFVLEDAQGSRLVSSTSLYSDPQTFVRSLTSL
jgi:putative protein-disulfide isomerase